MTSKEYFEIKAQGRKPIAPAEAGDDDFTKGFRAGWDDAKRTFETLYGNAGALNPMTKGTEECNTTATSNNGTYGASRGKSAELPESNAAMDPVTVEAVAEAIDAARYDHPEHPRDPDRPFSKADRHDREYATRLARAAIRALSHPAPTNTGEARPLTQTIWGAIAAVYGDLDDEDCAFVDRTWAKQRGLTIATSPNAPSQPGAVREALPTFSAIKKIALNTKPDEVKDALAHIVRLCIDAGSAPPLKRNWTEDAAHENGNYECHCFTCDQSFVGHKRRVTCKACAALATPAAVETQEHPK